MGIGARKSKDKRRLFPDLEGTLSFNRINILILKKKN